MCFSSLEVLAQDIQRVCYQLSNLYISVGVFRIQIKIQHESTVRNGAIHDRSSSNFVGRIRNDLKK